MSKVVFAVPTGTPAARCRACGATIYWVLTLAGKRMPVTSSGESHFADCPAAASYRKGKTFGVVDPVVGQPQLF